MPRAAVRVPWAELGIVALALLLRVLWLEIKPPHFDEGVNGWFVDQMTEQGYYHYDPTNFHGPFHFYVLFLAQTLCGRHAWALRLPIALASTACVALVLAFRPFLGKQACRLAALAMALSPGFVFYGRYAIHETWLLFFAMLAAWGCLGLWRFGTARWLWAAGLGAAGMVLTKETYVIHFVALALAVPALLLLEKITRTRGHPRARMGWTERELWMVCVVCLGLIVFFYSGALLDWSSLPGLITTMREWVSTGVDSAGGHAKPWHYWLELLARYEWPATLGLLASGWCAFAERDRAMRWLILGGWAAMFAYSVVSYKTPWCLIAFAWPFLFVFGHLLVNLRRRLDRWLAGALAATVLGHSAVSAWLLNFHNYADETEPYAYVQTLPAIERLLGPLRTLVALDPANRHLTGHLLFPAGASHPLPWLLRDYPQIRFLEENETPAQMDADVLVIDEPFVSDVEDRLRERYFREPLIVRGNSGESAQLYFRAAMFAPFFPGRTPEFEPVVWLPAPEAPAVP